MTVRVYKGLSGLAAVGPAWRAVFAASASDNPFLTWEWSKAWAERFADHEAVRVLVAEEKDVPVAVAPLLAHRGRVSSLADNLFADYAEFVLAGRAGEAAVPELVSACMEQGRVLEVGPVRSISPTAHALDALGEAAPGIWLREGICPDPIVAPDGAGFDAYLARRPKKLRQELRTTINHLQRGGPWRFDEATVGEPFEAMFDALAAFHNRRQDQKAGRSIFATDEGRGFLRALPQLLGDAPVRPRMSAIWWQDRIVSAAYSLECGTTLFYWIPSFDPSIRSASLGKLHIRCLIERCFARGMTFDFMGGDETYKLQWAEGGYEVYRYMLYSGAMARIFGAMKLQAREALRGALRGSRHLAAIRKSLSKLTTGRNTPEQSA